MNKIKRSISGRKGFTLIELLIVMVILIVLAMIMVGNIDPINMVNKGKDARRKKDLGRIKVAFEEYMSDKDCYPLQNLVDSLGCESGDFAPWLANWPCDPNKKKYRIIVDPEHSDCPKWYKVYTNLENKKDTDIPPGWLSLPASFKIGDGFVTAREVNYGVSSPNVLWNEYTLPAFCGSMTGQCYTRPGAGICQTLSRGEEYRTNVYISSNCEPECQTLCCYDGEVCI